MISALLCLASPALIQATPESRDHARLHPGQASYFAQILDLGRIGEAYSEAPLVKLLRDTRLHEFAATNFGVEIDPGVVDPVAGFELLLDLLPPEAVAMGADELLRDVHSASISVSVPKSAGRDLGALARSFMATLELGQVKEAIERDLALAAEGAEPDIARASAADPGLAIDPWGNAYSLIAVEDVGHALVCLGADGAVGGEGPAADIELPLAFRGEPEPDIAALSDWMGTLGVQVILEFGSDVSPRQIMSMLAAEAGGALAEEEGVTVREFGVGGQTYTAIEAQVDDEGLSFGLFLAHHGSTLVLGGLSTDLDGYLAGLGGSTLESDALYQAVLGGLPSDDGTPIQTSFRRMSDAALYIEALQDALDGGLVELVVREAPEVAEFAPLVGMLAAIEVDHRPTSSRTVLGDGRFTTHTFHHGAGKRSPAFPGGAIVRDRFAPVGADAAMVMAGDVDLQAGYEMIMRAVTAAAPMEREELEQELIGVLGFDPRTELLPSMGSKLTIALDPIRGIGAPKLMGYLDLHDAEPATRGVEQLFAGIAQASQGALSSRSKPYRKMPLVRMDIAEFGFVEPSVGVVGDQLVMGLSGVHVKKDLRRLSGDEVDAHPVKDPAQVAIPDGATSFVYADFGQMLGAAWDAGRAMASLAGGFVDELPFDPSTLPPGSVFTDHLPVFMSTMVPVEGGELRTTVKPLGPEAMVIPQVAVAALGAFQAEGSVPLEYAAALDAPAPEPADAGSGTAATDRAMIELRTALEIYYLETGGRYPSDLAILSEPTENFPRGTLDGQPLPNDGWGKAFAYVVKDDRGGYTLWSFGANGVDEGGRGDDVAVDEN